MTQIESSLPLSSAKSSLQTDALRAHLLDVILKFIICATIIYASALLISGDVSTLFELLYVLNPIPVCALLLILMRRGHILLSALIFVVLVWLSMFFGAVLAGGIRAPAFSGFILPILLAGWLVGRRMGLMIALLSAATGGLLIRLYADGWVVARVENSDFSIWISQLFFFGIAAAVLYIATQNSDKLLRRLRHNEELALEANQQLRAEINRREGIEKELQFQANVLAEVQDAIMVTDIERNVLYWNRGAEQTYGLSSEQTLGQSISSIFDFDKGINTGSTQIDEALLTTGVWQGEDTSIIRSTGKTVDVETRIKLAMDETGMPSHVIVSARDIRERVEAQEVLRYRTELQQLVTQLATQFIDLPTSEMNQGMTQALQMLCEFFHVERGIISLFSEDYTVLRAQHEYLADISSMPPATYKGLPSERIPWCVARLKQFEPALISSVDEMPPEASVDQNTFQARGVKSIALIPLIQNDKLVGLLGYSSDKRVVNWSSDITDQLHVLSQIIVNLFERRTFEQTLRARDVELNALTSQLYTLRDIDRAIFSAQSLHDVVTPALKRLFELCNCQCTSLFLFDDREESGTYFAKYSSSEEIAFREFFTLADISDLEDLRDGIILLNGTVEDQQESKIERELSEQTGCEAIARIPLKTHGLLIGILYLGFETTNALELLDIELVEGVATSLALAIANTQLYEQVQSHADSLEEKIAASTAKLKQQYNLKAALAQIELAINQPSELENVLTQIIAVTGQAFPADKGASIILWDPETETYSVSATSVAGQEKNETASSVRKQGGTTRQILERKQTIVVANTQTNSLKHNGMIEKYSIGAYVGVPLLFEGQAIGVLYALMSQPQSFSADQLAFIEAVASRAALAITKVRLFGQAKELAVEEERQRLARELHDVVSQSLFSASLIAESLPLLMDRNPEMVRTELGDLHLLTRGAANEMRMLLYELRPDDLIQSELGELIHKLVSAFTGRTRIPVDVSIGSEMNFPPAMQLGIYRIAQETFNNIAKHARATQVWLTMSYVDEEFALCIRDDGRGFEIDAVTAGHMGLTIMRERAAEIDATLSISSNINEGTMLTLHRTTKEKRTTHGQFELDQNIARR